ncbi:MAG: efflux RND transporter periplasmic adaptor subunit [Acidobacteriaceae bacterium]|jgi:HlyD family secretion protein
MKLKKILIISGAVLVAAGIAGFTIVRAQSGYTKVLTAKVVRQNLVSIVSGTGQIKPKTYVNIGATSFGRITHLYVKEGDHVKKGQVLATVESVQAKAGVDAQQASIRSADTDIASYLAAEKTAEATVAHSEADLNQKLLDWQRAQALYKAELIAKSEYDSKKAAYDTDVATLAQSKAALVQARAQTASARGKLGTAQATLTSDVDALNKTVSIAPFDGIVTNMPVREGETVVVGIQNAQGSTLMTLADPSVITAEVKVDETDIVNVAMGQPVEVTVDALPGKVFQGKVTEVGDQAILRSTGIATSQSTTGTEEAKDFKVVVTLSNPPEELRPGLSATAKITTARRQNVLTIPIQALAMRTPASLKVGASMQTVNAASDGDSPPASAQDPGTQGVFVLRSHGSKLQSQFVPVTTGITGATDIEVTAGLKQGDEIVIGPYKVLRTLKNDVKLKRDNGAATQSTESS